MTSLDGLDDLHMSGARAVFTLHDGADLARADVAAAFEDHGMRLESFDKVQRARAQGYFVVDAGIT